ncbi:MAG TPA: hypothetical protein VHT03_09320 [Rhizomicrobium sp.]|nr:hypothetical protein [Rhizomicrobium sp.]
MSLRVFVVAAVFASLPVAAFAQVIDLTPYSGRILSDPEFLPMAGQLYGTTAYSHGWVDGNSVNGAGTQFSTFHINTNTLDQLLAYGITDDISLNARIQYAPQDYREIDYTNGKTGYLDSSGFSDPTFGATWRVLDQNTYPANFDLFGSYTPDWISAHTGTAVQDATVARGGSSGIIGAALGVVTQGFTIRGAFNANFLGQSSILNLSNGEVLQTGSHTNFDLSLDTQTRLSDLFSVNAGVSHTFASNTSGISLTNGASRNDQPGDTTELAVALNYNFIPNAFVISATYAHDFYGNSETLYANPAFDSGTRDKSGNILGVKLYYATP